MGTQCHVRKAPPSKAGFFVSLPEDSLDGVVRGNGRRHEKCSADGKPPRNFTVKLEEAFRKRIERAQRASGSNVWSEFCRAALMERCRKIETELRGCIARSTGKFTGPPVRVKRRGRSSVRRRLRLVVTYSYPYLCF